MIRRGKLISHSLIFIECGKDKYIKDIRNGVPITTKSFHSAKKWKITNHINYYASLLSAYSSISNIININDPKISKMFNVKVEDHYYTKDDIKNDESGYLAEELKYWHLIITRGMEEDLIELSKIKFKTTDEDEVFEQEDEFSIRRFVKYLPTIHYKHVVVLAVNWHNYTEIEQVDFATRLIGIEEASRFMIFLDWFNKKIIDGDFA